MWALGVQSLPEPFDKILAILSPGVGYIAGHGVQSGLIGVQKRLIRAKNKKSISDIDQSIAELHLALESTKDAGEISMINDFISKARKRRVEIIADGIPS